MTLNYDPKNHQMLINYLDMNNLYGWAMSSYLPYCESKWLKNVDNLNVNSISEMSPIGYVLKVDIEHSDESHVLNNDYPIAPEKLAISYDMLSDYYQKLVHKYGIQVGDAKWLIPNLNNKTNYVLHYRNIQVDLSLGIKLTKINKVLLKFKQCD